MRFSRTASFYHLTICSHPHSLVSCQSPLRQAMRPPPLVLAIELHLSYTESSIGKQYLLSRIDGRSPIP